MLNGTTFNAVGTNGYNCCECGSHELLVKHFYTMVTTINETHNCMCGSSCDGSSYVNRYEVHTPCFESFTLDSNFQRSGEMQVKEKLSPGKVVDLGTNISCFSCYNTAWNDEASQEPSIEDFKNTKHKYYGLCQECGHRVKISYIDQAGGGIFQVGPFINTNEDSKQQYQFAV